MREVYRTLVTAKRHAERDHDQRVTQAWLTARLSRAEKIPRLETLLVRDSEQKQSVGELRSMVDALSQLYGLPLRKARGRRGK